MLTRKIKFFLLYLSSKEAVFWYFRHLISVQLVYNIYIFYTVHWFFLEKNIFEEQWGVDCQNIKNNLRTTQGWMQAIKKIYLWWYDIFLKQKCLNISIYTAFYNKTSSIPSISSTLPLMFRHWRKLGILQAYCCNT